MRLVWQCNQLTTARRYRLPSRATRVGTTYILSVLIILEWFRSSTYLHFISTTSRQNISVNISKVPSFVICRCAYNIQSPITFLYIPFLLLGKYLFTYTPRDKPNSCGRRLVGLFFLIVQIKTSFRLLVQTFSMKMRVIQTMRVVKE